MNKSIKNSQILPFYFIVIGLFVTIISSNMFSDGMFMDGLLYSAISKNLSQGIGTFWNLHLSNTLFNSFHEHPPLAFGLQSIFYDIFGYSKIIDKLYSLVTFIIVGFIIIKIWKAIGKSVLCAWIPLLFWFSIPLVSWAISNNILENTLSIFISLSVLFYFKSIKQNEKIYLFLCGLMLSLGFLTKGFVAFFPWTLPFIYWIVYKNVSFLKMIFNSFLIFICTILPIIILMFISTEAKDSIINYLNIQVLESLKNVETVTSRFFIINRLFFELLPAILITLILIFISWRKKNNIIKFDKNIKLTIVFLLLGLSGVIPIMISLKQSGFYIIATFPFFALAFSLLVLPFFEVYIEKINFNSISFKCFKYASIIVLIIGISLSINSKNNIRKEDDKLKELYLIMHKLPNNSTINICPPMYQDWALHGYFIRYKNISLDVNYNNRLEYFLIQNSCCSDTIVSNNYILIDLPIKQYKLYQYKN